ncbi:extracellular solute-binding protein [Paenibacillus beijingensis]|uniref:ABC transporter substrate-binding protein n=1 Tax=Paenibacillus beijingensis TaxID=1126833 RepID=A0A0D5NH67_9BACL|nr:extracellular solute-binding protein [Paenibacillus beijingensis]AJY74258.1 hypothetical protein VN24_06285 [Paenibacillus beijingensis]
MNRLHRGIAGFIVVLSILATAACSGNNNAGQPQQDTGTASPNGQQQQQEQQPVEIKMMADYGVASFFDTDRHFMDMIEKGTNTKLTVEVPPTTGYKERLQLMLSTGDYPDIVYFPSASDPSFLNAVRDGIVLPVNGYLDQAPEIKKYTYDTTWDVLKVNQDDNIYGIPRTSVVRNDGYWIRKDWAANVGIELPADGTVTLEQFADILRKFTKNDPDRNGKNDTYGFAGSVDKNKVLQPIVASSFGELGWQKASGGSYEYIDLMYDRTSDGYKKALQYTQDLYKEGLFEPNSATTDSTKAYEGFFRGVAGVVPAFAGTYISYRDEVKKLNPDAEVTFVHVKNEQGEVKGAPPSEASTGMWGLWAIMKGSENPQKAVEVLNYWLTDEAWTKVKEGYEGTDYQVVDGSKQYMKERQPAPLRRNSMRRAGDSDFFIDPGTSTEDLNIIKPWLDRSVSSVVPNLSLDYVPDASKQPNYMDYQKVWQQTIMKIVLGDEPVGKFDELLDGWYKNGGEEYVRQMNDYIKKLSKA